MTIGSNSIYEMFSKLFSQLFKHFQNMSTKVGQSSHGMMPEKFVPKGDTF